MSEFTLAGPHQFTEQDLVPERLMAGAERTLADFYEWRDANPTLIAEHVDYHSELLQEATDGFSLPARMSRRISSSRREQFEQQQLTREIGFFCVYNLAELPKPEKVELFRTTLAERSGDIKRVAANGPPNGVRTMLGELEVRIPELKGTPELEWLDEQVTRLHGILPDTVIEEGGMGKAARTMAGVLAIGSLDTLGEDEEVVRDHLRHILPAAYAYGAMYPIIDDTLQDGNYVSQADHQRYHTAILHGLQTGEAIDTSDLPDHPLAEELLRVYDMLLETFPYRQHRSLYHAGESMYLAQDRDSRRLPADSAEGLAGMYPDIFVKAAMTRTVANILGRREMPDGYYAHSININFINQFRDDLGDREKDLAAGRLTPFTYPRTPNDTNPLYDLFAYSAYLGNTIFEGDARALEVLTHFSANRLAVYMQRNPDHAQTLLHTYDTTSEMSRFIEQSSGLSAPMARRLRRKDTEFETAVGDAFKHRKPANTDPRTFVSDRLDYINNVIREAGESDTPTRVSEIADYALEAGGKRLRPALTLMLAESLGVDYKKVEPLLVALERFHTSSLIFDDLPAQDNASLRRGKPTAHTAYDEAGAQLAGISLLSSGFGVLADLRQHYPAQEVTDVIKYFGSILGPERLCLGQDMDLQFEAGTVPTIEELITMYDLKTSTTLEAAIVPLMMLENRPPNEIGHIKAFAHHAGIVFQLRDDILDATADTQKLGKDAQNDLEKMNVVRSFGMAEACRRLEEHLELAVQACSDLPFNTALLQGIVRYFAVRAR